MPVTVDTTGTLQDNTTAVTSTSYTGITVGSGTNRALIFGIIFSGGANFPSAVTATWDSGGTNQAMTSLLTAPTITANNGAVWLFGLRNPTSGNKTLAVSWTTAAQFSAGAISFNGVNQTSDAAAFPNAATNTGTGTSASLTVTSASGDIAVNVATGALSTSNQTQIFLDANPANDGGMQRAAGAGSINFTWTGPSNPWAMAGVDIAAAASPVISRPLKRIVYQGKGGFF